MLVLQTHAPSDLCSILGGVDSTFVNIGPPSVFYIQSRYWVLFSFSLHYEKKYSTFISIKPTVLPSVVDLLQHCCAGCCRPKYITPLYPSITSHHGSDGHDRPWQRPTRGRTTENTRRREDTLYIVWTRSDQDRTRILPTPGFSKDVFIQAVGDDHDVECARGTWTGTCQRPVTIFVMYGMGSWQ